MYVCSQCSCSDHFEVSWQHPEQYYAENRNTGTNNTLALDTIHTNTQWDKCPMWVLRPIEDNPVSNSLLEPTKARLCWGRYQTILTMDTWHQGSGLNTPYFNPLCSLFWLSAERTTQISHRIPCCPISPTTLLILTSHETTLFSLQQTGGESRLCYYTLSQYCRVLCFSLLKFSFSCMLSARRHINIDCVFST